MKSNYKFKMNYINKSGQRESYSFYLTSFDLFEADEFASNKCKNNGWSYIDVEAM